MLQSAVQNKRAIDLNETGQTDIYKINKLKGMLQPEDEVSAETIKHFGNTPKIQL